MVRGRIRRGATLLGAAALALTGCSSSSQDELVTAGDTAPAVVTAALDAAQAGTGRIEIAFEVDEAAVRAASERFAELHGDTGLQPSDSSEDWPEEVGPEPVVMEFDGEDARILDGDEGAVVELRVDGRSYQSTSALAESSWGPEDESAETDFSMPRPELPEGVAWVEIGADEVRYPTGPSSMSLPDGQLHLVRSDQLRDITDAGPAEVDGSATRRFSAVVTQEATEALLDLDGDSGAEPADGEDAEGEDAEEEDELLDEQISSEIARYDAVQEYLVEHTTVRVEIHLDDRDRLVQLQLVTALEVDPEYEDCTFFLMSGWPVTLTADYALGGDVEIVAPPADQVISQRKYDLLVDTAFEQWTPPGISGPVPLGPSDRAYLPDGEAVVLATSAGERFRADVEDDLVKFGSVIDLDPASVAEMDDAALVDAHDRAATAIAALPRTSTALGELTRVELLWNVKWGMETLGVDPALADSMDDAALAGLIDGYVGENGVSGDAAWGDGPMSLAEMESEGWLDEEGDEPGSEDLVDLDRIFESCPA